MENFADKISSILILALKNSDRDRHFFPNPHHQFLIGQRSVKLVQCTLCSRPGNNSKPTGNLIHLPKTF